MPVGWLCEMTDHSKQDSIKMIKELTSNTSYFIVCEATCFGPYVTIIRPSYESLSNAVYIIREQMWINLSSVTTSVWCYLFITAFTRPCRHWSLANQYHFLKIHFNTMFPSSPRSSKSSLPSGVQIKTLHNWFSPQTCQIPCPSHPPWSDNPKMLSDEIS